MKIILNTNKNRTPEELESERANRYKNLSAVDKMKELCKLIELSIMLGGSNSLKSPEKKGIVLFKSKGKAV